MFYFISCTFCYIGAVLGELNRNSFKVNNKTKSRAPVSSSSLYCCGVHSANLGAWRCWVSSIVMQIFIPSKPIFKNRVFRESSLCKHQKAFDSSYLLSSPWFVQCPYLLCVVSRGWVEQLWVQQLNVGLEASTSLEADQMC